MGYAPSDPTGAVLADPEAAAIIAEVLPGFTRVPVRLGRITFEQVFDLDFLRGRLPAEDILAGMWARLAALPGSAPVVEEDHVPAPRDDYEGDDVERGGATWRQTTSATQWGVTELAFAGPSHGNPFVDVDLQATFTADGHDAVTVGGFYDGGGSYLIRLCAPAAGTWTFVTRSTARSLDGITGSVDVQAPLPGHHGPVRVADTFHFAHADGTRNSPIGTTVYAWTHQTEELEDRTLESITATGFRKLRLCVFPKHYDFNHNEPPREPFARNADGSWDWLTFVPEFFRHLEHRIAQLQERGVEADVILFHPYDRWGFSEMSPDVDDHYLRYVVRRLSAYANVWWSLANEYDLMLAKSTEDWDRFAAVIAANDHVGHLTSIHNWVTFFDHGRPWITHVSAQRTEPYRTTENTDLWRDQYGKPVVVDETGYEGDLPHSWGNLSGRELVRRFWEGTVRGGYVGHGETYLNPEGVIFWSRGGDLVGQSPARIAFLLRILEEAPGGVLDPLPNAFGPATAGTDDHRLTYFGFNCPRYQDIHTEPGRRWHVDVIDTWNMTVERLPEVQEGNFRIDLPGRENMAVRMVAAE